MEKLIKLRWRVNTFMETVDTSDMSWQEFVYTFSFGNAPAISREDFLNSDCTASILRARRFINRINNKKRNTEKIEKSYKYVFNKYWHYIDGLFNKYWSYIDWLFTKNKD